MISAPVAPQPVPFQSASLYVGDLHPDITEGVLFELFNRVGPVASIRICRDTITKRSLGYGYVNFHNVQDAERAIDTMNFSDIKDRPCRIMWSQRDPHLRKSGVGNIFIKNLPPAIDHKQLFDMFSVFGNILSCKVVTDSTGTSKGYGYIHYETAEAANEAILKFHGNSVDDYTVQVLAFLRRQDRSSQTTWTNLYVKHFPKTWDEATLKELFGKNGEILSLAIMRDETGASRGFAFVNFADHEAASAALNALHNFVVEDGGQSFNLYVGRAQKRIERQRELASLYMQKREEKLNQFQGRNVYVKNIDDEVTDEELLKLFSEHGTVANAKIMREGPAGPSKGFGFVCYNSPEDALKAITALNGTRIRSKPLMVTLHQPKNIRMAHLAATFSNRMRGGGFNQGPGAMVPMPYMFGGQNQGGFPGGPGQQRFYGDFPGGPRGAPGNNPRGAMPLRSPFYPMPPYGMPQQGGPMGQQGMMQQRGRIGGPGMGGPMGPGPMGGQMGGPMSGRGGMRNGPRPGSPSGRGMPPQFQQGPRGVKFNNQVRNQPIPVGMPGAGMNMGGMPPQQIDMPGSQMNAVASMSMSEPLDHTVLAEADPQTQKNMIGERLYPLVYMHEPQRAGKITGMLLEMEITELLNLLESPDALLNKVREAVMVLEQHERGNQ